MKIEVQGKNEICIDTPSGRVHVSFNEGLTTIFVHNDTKKFGSIFAFKESKRLEVELHES